jgi:hypothetical protein
MPCSCLWRTCLRRGTNRVTSEIREAQAELSTEASAPQSGPRASSENDELGPAPPSLVECRLFLQ